MLKAFKAVPPFVTDINLSLDDRFLYVSCWGTGELRQYDVSDPFTPKLTGSLHIGGIVNRAAHPARPNRPLNGGPQMVEVSRDGRRVYFTNALYSPVDEQFYPDGIEGWMVKADVRPGGRHRVRPRLPAGVRGRDPNPPGPSPGRRLFLRLLLLLVRAMMDFQAFWPWLALLLLGAWHGINPGMGWLFAVALGLQEQKRRAVWRALLPLALGHGLAIAAAILAGLLLGLVLPVQHLKWLVAGMLVGFGLYRLVRHRHPRWGGMRVGFRDLTVWSLLMASAHGAGLMVLPFVLGTAFRRDEVMRRRGWSLSIMVPRCWFHGRSEPRGWTLDAPRAHEAVQRSHPNPLFGADTGHGVHAAAILSGLPEGQIAGLLAALLHTGAYLLVMGIVAVIVYEKLGLRLLRSMWFNLDLIWSGALIFTGVLAPLL
jgi:hypothetical protein